MTRELNPDSQNRIEKGPVFSGAISWGSATISLLRMLLLLLLPWFPANPVQAASTTQLRMYRKELSREGPFEVLASASDAGDIDGYRRLGAGGVTHILTMPWAFYHGITDDLDKKLDGIRRFGDEVIAKMA